MSRFTCLVLPVLFWLSRSCCPILAVLFWLSCPSYRGCPFLAVLFWLSFFCFLSWLSSPGPGSPVCPGDPALSRSACPVLPVLICLPCSACPVLPVLFCLSRFAESAINC
jgi:hypothetical protein